MQESGRDSGLVRAVTSWGLFASIVNCVVGAGIFAVPAALAASVGAYAPLAFLCCAIGIGAVAICFAEGGSRVPTSGGSYGYIEIAFGPAAGYIAGTLLWFGNVLACGSLVAALADVVASVLPKAWMAATHATVIVVVIAGFALVNIRGVAAGTRLVELTTAIKLVPLAIFVLAGAGAVHTVNFLQASAPTSGGVGRAIILASFSFTGMEVALSASGEIADPARSIPRALAAAMLSITLLYVIIQLIAQGILGPALPHSAAPLADAMNAVYPGLRAVMLAGAGLSMLGYIAGDILGSPRMLFAFAREGLMLRILGRVHPASHAPHAAILGYAAIAIGLALSGTFAELAVLSTLAAAAQYILACAAAWRLSARGVALAGVPLEFHWLRPAAAIGIASMIILITLAAPVEIVGLVVVIGASGLLYFCIRRLRKPSTADARAT